nr:hypothetical protein [Actinomycetales bacterium]
MATTKKTSEGAGFTEAEKAAMKQRAGELKEEKAKKTGRSKKDPLQDVLDAIAAMEPADRAIAERLHEVITTAAPSLQSKTWYGFPSYAKDGKVLVFYQPGAKFGTRYGSLGFNDVAQLDDGNMWPTAYAIAKLTKTMEKDIAALVKRAVGEG